MVNRPPHSPDIPLASERICSQLSSATKSPSFHREGDVGACRAAFHKQATYGSRLQKKSTEQHNLSRGHEFFIDTRGRPPRCQKHFEVERGHQGFSRGRHRRLFQPCAGQMALDGPPACSRYHLHGIPKRPGIPMQVGK